MDKKQLVKTLRSLADRISKKPDTDPDFPDLLMEVVGVGIDVMCLPAEDPEPDTVYFYPSPSLRYRTPNGSVLGSYNNFRFVVAGSTSGITSHEESKLWLDELKAATVKFTEQMQKTPMAAASDDQNISGN